MKKGLVLLAMLVSMSANAQLTQKARADLNKIRWNPQKIKSSIVDDNITADSIRVTCSSMRVTNATDVKAFMFMGVVGLPSKTGTKYRLNFYISKEDGASVKADSPVLIKLGDDSRVELKVSYSHEFAPRIYASGITAPITLYETVFSCDINDDFIEKISKGIKKIRYERNSSASDVEFKVDNISEFIKESYELVKEKSKENRSFDDGF